MVKVSIGLQLRARCTNPNRQLVVVEQLANTVTKVLQLVAGSADVVDVVDGTLHGRCWVDAQPSQLLERSAELVLCAGGNALLFSTTELTELEASQLRAAARQVGVDGELCAEGGGYGGCYYPYNATELNALLLALA